MENGVYGWIIITLSWFAPAASLSLPNGQHPDTVESEITEIEIETLDSPVYQRLGTEPLQPQYAEIPWINNPLFQELAS